MIAIKNHISLIQIQISLDLYYSYIYVMNFLIQIYIFDIQASPWNIQLKHLSGVYRTINSSLLFNVEKLYV